LILQHQNNQIGVGAQKVYGILFDGSWLWEEYVNILIGDYFHHPMNKSRKEVQYLFDGKEGKIYPDFISRELNAPIIADAKYKPLDNIRGDDYLQLLAYMFRFDAKIGYYLYPESKDKNDLRYFLNKGTSYEGNVSPRNDIHVVKHGLKIPNNCINYDDFKTKIKSNENEFVGAFLRLRL
jgi:5-methylcytosine-specific restriction endonuclease McrBC regulatory subunit McrC